MQIQIVTFNLKGLSDGDYRAVCDAEAPTFAALPGLISKVWLADKQTNTYGGVYTWADQQAMEAFVRSDFFRAMSTDPTIENLTSKAFGVLEGPSRITGTALPVAA